MRVISFVHLTALSARHPTSSNSRHKISTIRRPLQFQLSHNISLPLQMASSVTAEEPRKRPSNNSNNTNNSPSRAEKKRKSATSDIDLLQNWIEHDNHTYHVDTFLTPSQAYKIRTRLVSWYRANRRQLPWRGDPGPYDGSTVGYAASASSTASSKGKKKNKKGGKKDDNNNGKDIRSFFGGASKAKREETTNEAEEEKKEETDVVASFAEIKDEGNSRELTAYGIWVSEIMLQQTRVEAVIKYWIKWMDSFPTVHSLANATPEEVNAHWAGLGFYRRARLLHAGAKRVVNDYGGIVPNTVDELMKVEGIGRYTASAIASIAYGVEVPVVDGNVCRVLSRLTGIANHIKAPVMKDDLGWVLAEKIVKARSSSATTETDAKLGTPGEVNQALMELGATYCSPAGSGIDANDPLVEFYASTKLGRAIGYVTNSAGGATKEHVEDLVAKGAFNTDENKGRCRLCELNGASNAFYSISDKISADLLTSPNVKLESVSAIAGHACLPIPPPKKAKREEVLAVAVISSQVVDDDRRRWLMVKRPSEGLLAGQWEFPNVEVWNSAKADGKREKKDKTKSKSEIEVPIIDPSKRSKALNSFISDILDESTAMQKRKQIKDAPITHIFSHVTHTMWIEYNHLDEDIASNKRWKLENGREAGWMSEDDMKDVGITSGVHKILAKVKIM